MATDERPRRTMNVLLLGAGASLGARAGMATPLPPLGNGLAGYLSRWLDVNDTRATLRPFMEGYYDQGVSKCPHYAGHALWSEPEIARLREALRQLAAEEATTTGSPTPFEALMDRWGQAGSDHSLVELAQRVIAYSMMVGFRCAFMEGRDRLDDLLAWMTPSIVVSVNYDLLLEQALVRRSIRYTYPGISGPRGSGVADADFESPGEGQLIPVFKLHGSVGWLSVGGAVAGADLAQVEKISSERVTKFEWSGPYLAPQTWATYSPPNTPSWLYEMENSPVIGQPVIAVYGRGKPLLQNPEHVRAHREACLNRVRSEGVDRVVAIGIRPVSSDDDPVVADLIELLGGAREKVYVGPSPSDCEKFRQWGFLTVCGTLEAFLRLVGRP